MLRTDETDDFPRAIAGLYPQQFKFRLINQRFDDSVSALGFCLIFNAQSWLGGFWNHAEYKLFWGAGFGGDTPRDVTRCPR